MKRFLAALAAVALVGTGAAVAVSTPASAHTGSLATTSVCSDDGATRTITYSGTTTSVPSKQTATITVKEVKPEGSTVTTASPSTLTGNGTFSFTQTVPGTVTSGQAAAYIAWGDGVKSDPIGTWKAPNACAVPVKPVVVSHIQDYNTCTLNAFVLDNLGSNVPVTYDINGVKYPVAAGTALHTDQGGVSLEPNADGEFVITTDHGASWTFTAKSKQDCTEKPKDVVVVSKPVETTDCKASDVLIETTTTTTPYVWDAKTETYVPGTPKSETVETHRAKTAAEIEKCAVVPPVTTPTATPTPSSYVPAAPKPTQTPTAAPVAPAKAAAAPKGELAFTGSEGLAQGALAALILSLLGTGVLVTRRRLAAKKN